MKRFASVWVGILLVVLGPSGAMAQEVRMGRASLDGIELDYEVRGAGEPVVLVHAGVFADWFKPLLTEPTLTSRYLW